MLQSIRDRTQGWIAGIIISILILSFALWGIHSYLAGNGATTTVAKVNGTEINKNQLTLTYERLKRQLQMQANSNYQIPLQAETELKNRALNSLITSEVLKQASIQDNYRISQLQMNSFLQSMPEFQVNGQFSVSRFRQLLTVTLYDPADFLELVRSSLLIDQPRLGIIFSSFALPNEIDTSIALVNQKRHASYAVLSLQSFLQEPITISDSEISAYYQQHQDQFKTPEQASISYIVLSPKDLMASINPSFEEVKKFYTDNGNLFQNKDSSLEPFDTVKDKVKAAYVQQQAEEKQAALRDKLANITYEHPESLEPAAKELGLKIQTSELFTRDKGGKDITENSKIRETAFSNDVLDLKNNSDVVQVGSDLVVLRINKFVPASLLTIDQVKPSIIEKLKTNKMEAMAAARSKEIVTKLQKGEPIEQINQQYHLTWTQMGYVDRRNKMNTSILATVFALPRPKDHMSSYGVAKIPEGYAIVDVSGVQDGLIEENDKKQYKAFAEQIQNTQGLIEYELYKQSVMQQAKITVNNP